MMLLNVEFEVMLAKGNFQSFFFNDYKKTHCNFPLEFLQQCLPAQGLCPTWFIDIVVKNNHSTLLQLAFLFISISFKVTLS